MQCFIQDDNCYFVVGGCRSGKSSYAQMLAEQIAATGVYIATAEVRDEEMRLRVRKHQSERSSAWQTLELPVGFGFDSVRSVPCQADVLAAALQNLIPASAKNQVFLFDCVTLWLAGCIEGGMTSEQLPTTLNALLYALFSLHHPLVLVSNEVGLGGISPTASGRLFCDLHGTANQIIAARADAVAFMVSGLPMVLKGTMPKMNGMVEVL